MAKKTSSVEKVLHEYGCSVCGRLLKPENAVDHPRAGKVHPECADLLKFKVKGGRSPSLADPSDWGAGYDEE